MIGIVDYNMGNLASVQNAFDKLGSKTKIESHPNKLQACDKLLLPGVGAFGDAMEHLNRNGMNEAIVQYAQSGKPILGICLGMQLLFDTSREFGEHRGLGLIAFDKTQFNHPLKVPHMGWNELFVTHDTPLFEGLNDPYLYFVHSFHALCDDKFVIGKSFYGYEFIAAVHRENIYGIQPHPEKSHDNGLKILKNFINL
ncbi:MAG: glutamine amidotransferase [Sulfurovum sp. PC08-66]|nr:MAG: glutamine amidotransferase [Sulfurovum sp. PC08-66]